MATDRDVFDAMQLIAARTGDPSAWKAGLTGQEVIDFLSPATPGQVRDALLDRIRRQHPDVFDQPAAPLPDRVPAPPRSPAQPDRADGDAANAIAEAEAALAHQNSVTSQLDLQVVSAILNAHLTTTEGKDALASLQREIEIAVATRSDLDTPAGARDFQRFLIGKLRDIRAVVATAGLDDTSKSALMAAWTSLYNASKEEPPRDRVDAAPAYAAGGGAQQATPAVADMGSDPLLDSLLFDDPAGAPMQEPAAMPAATSGGGLPASAAAPGAGTGLPSWGTPSGLSLPGLSGGAPGRDDGGLGDGLFDEEPDRSERKPADEDSNKDDPDHQDDPQPPADQGQPEATAGPTTVTLPTGETVTAASPQLAAAIKAAASGTPIPDAFQQQGITIPQPGTAVAHPVDLSQLTPGDIGIFTDRHALALGRSKALLDGQIQQIATVTGPSFLGWEHPPAPASPAPETAPPAGEAPTPTRPSATLTS
ncbi:DUF4226 domain-containing protein [Mycobacterium vicinigordonae]|uniref:DUF4226 domain-containing protein n=1 Tax=Mycobacterium vicinigordonae TaxID=1719132 RepID=A0A7D6I5L1_9MYCO|nr:DUF4226 domain-containing protein [Mycobacterium vicinigordonae]QLL07498.1 DUF4226 domain-containing protein [Mycobacterium vicinigordonae]